MIYSQIRLMLTVVSLLYFPGCRGDAAAETDAASPDNGDTEAADTARDAETDANPVADSIPVLHINTVDNVSITSKEEYVSCSVEIDGRDRYSDYSATGAGIRLRGNSTLVYYDKKPYRIKLGSRAPLLGMKTDKDWVLLANYRDPTNFMNAVAFDMARYMGMPYSNSNRFVEVYLNGDYIGMYQLTEQVEQGENRVAVDDENGVLLHLDWDDGPEAVPDAGDNFQSSIYQLPVCVKYPKDQTETQLDAIKKDFAELEALIENGDCTAVDSRLDIPSLIDFLIVQEMTRNVELVTPRSMYIYKSTDGIYHFGPVWDFDGGYAFDWASMSTGHNYFGSQTWVMGSSNPATHPMDAYAEISGFFVDMFACAEFVSAYRNRWNELKFGMLEDCFSKLDRYVSQCDSAMERNAEAWPIDKDFRTEIESLRFWLSERFASYTGVVENY